jgi:hypothetical protein
MTLTPQHIADAAMVEVSPRTKEAWGSFSRTRTSVSCPICRITFMPRARTTKFCSTKCARDGGAGRPFAQGGPSAIRNHPLEKIWRAMVYRCTNPKRKGFEHYGGRGISVDPRWMMFWDFVADIESSLGARPDGHSLDRIDNDGNYCPGNVRWASQKEQVRNSRHARILEFDGVRLCVSDWATRVGLSKWLITRRLNAGWSVSRALTEPRNENYDFTTPDGRKRNGR